MGLEKSCCSGWRIDKISMMDENVKKELTHLVESDVRWGCPLREYTSFKIGGPAEAVVEVGDRYELQLLLQFLVSNKLRWRVIGRGTNLLVRDEGFDGVILCLKGDFNSYRVEEENNTITVVAGAAYGLSKLSQKCAEYGFSGLEFGIGIPASIGGAVVMNAGAWGSSMAAVTTGVIVMTADGEKSWSQNELKFGYRRLVTLSDEKECIVTDIQMRLTRKEPEEIQKTCNSYRNKRSASQPLGLANAGSIFKNPVNDSAGRLIDTCGLKGKVVGDAMISEKHANFIVNRGNAKASDVLELISIVQDKVKRDCGVFLEPEVHIL